MMNERILSPQLLKLVQAAGPGYSLANPEWVKKFAELIVRECADIVEGYTLDTWSQRSGTFYLASNQIKQHFGVEE